MAKAPRFTERQAQALIDRAESAATAAFKAATPTPMVIGTPVNMMASLTGGDDGGFRTDRPIHLINEGVCGFAWVTVTPATSSFARRAKDLTRSHRGYYGGLEISPEAMGFSQSLERKSAACRAYAEVLREAGIDAHAGSRMD